VLLNTDCQLTGTLSKARKLPHKIVVLSLQHLDLQTLVSVASFDICPEFLVVILRPKDFLLSHSKMIVASDTAVINTGFYFLI